MGEAYKMNENKFEYENSRTNMARSDEKTMGDLKTSAVGIYEDAKDLVGLNAVNYDNPLDSGSNSLKSKTDKNNPIHTSEKGTQAQKDFDAINKGRK